MFSFYIVFQLSVAVCRLQFEGQRRQMILKDYLTWLCFCSSVALVFQCYLVPLSNPSAIQWARKADLLEEKATPQQPCKPGCHNIWDSIQIMTFNQKNGLAEHWEGPHQPILGTNATIQKKEKSLWIHTAPTCVQSGLQQLISCWIKDEYHLYQKRGAVAVW